MVLGWYDWAGRSAKRHRGQIREVFGFREFTRVEEERFTGWLDVEVCPFEPRDEVVRGGAFGSGSGGAG